MSGQSHVELFNSLVEAAKPLNDQEVHEDLEQRLIEVVEKNVFAKKSKDFLTDILEHIRDYVAKVHRIQKNLWAEHNEFILALCRLLGFMPMKEENKETVAA